MSTKLRSTRKNGNDGLRQAFVSCLLGGAIGDALGMPIERVAKSVIDSSFSLPIRCYHDPVAAAPCHRYGLKRGMYTDDTQSVRATAISIAEHKSASPNVIADALSAWLFDNSLGQIPRYPGQTTWTAMTRYKADHDPSTCGVASDTCGAAIRIAPVSLWFSRQSLTELEKGIVAAAMVTHTSAGAIDGAMIVARLIRAASEGNQPTLSELSGICRSRQMARAITSVATALDEKLPANDVAEQIGGGTKAREVIPMALFHLYGQGFRFQEALESGLDTRHPGGIDMDSILGIVGGIAGAFRPEQVAASSLVGGLDGREEIIEEAESLYCSAFSH